MHKKVNVCGTCGRRNVRAVLCSKVLFFQLWFLPRKSLWEKKEFFFRYVVLGQMGREITGGRLQKLYAFGMHGGGRRGKGRGENRSLSAAEGSAGGGGGGWKSISPLTIPFLSGHGQPLNELRRFPTHVSECVTPKQDRPRNQIRGQGKGM